MYGYSQLREDEKMERKAQGYLLIGILLAGFVLLALYSIRITYRARAFSTFELENLKRELPVAYASGVYNEDLNYVMAHTSESFKNFYRTKQITLKLLFIAYDDNGHYILGNFWGQDCAYSGTAISGVVKDGTTRIINKETLLNDYSLIFCGKQFDLTNKFFYYAELHKEEEVIKK